ncbi:MAG TPA: hypothetical protein PLX85_01480 [Dehalococcoidia bacterium]|nr:hypothetical protein [Dehalococcoidia bacterium]
MSAPPVLVPLTSRLPLRRDGPLLPSPLRALPVAGGIAGVALAGLATEYVLRAAAVHVIETLIRRPAPKRAVVTEVTVIERFRRD